MSLLKRFRQTKVKKSELSMSEKTMSTSCPQSVSHEKVGECRNNSKYKSQKTNRIFFFLIMNRF